MSPFIFNKPPDIEKLKSKKDVKGLIKCLQHKEWLVQLDAALALAELNSSAGIVVLLKAVWTPNSADWNRLDKIFKYLYQLYDPKIEGSLEGLFLFEPEKVDERVFQQAKGLLMYLKPTDETRKIIREAELRRSEPEAARLLDKLVHSTDSNLKFDDYDYLTRYAEDFKNIGNRAVESLIWFLNARYRFESMITPYHRRVAIIALGKIRDTRALEPLINFMNNNEKDSYFYDEYIAKAFVDIGDDRCVEALVNRLARGVSGSFAATHIAKALETFGYAHMVEVYVSWLKGADWNLRRYAVIELDKLGWQPDSDEIKVLYWMTKEDWDMLVKIGAPAVESLIHLLEHPPISGYGYIYALGKIGDPRAFEPLVSALNSIVLNESECAAAALGQLGDKRGLEALIKHFDETNYPNYLYEKHIEAIKNLSQKYELSEAERERVNATLHKYEIAKAEAIERSLHMFPDDGT